MRVDGIAVDFVLQCTVRQHFVNTSDHAIEAVYVFPLDERAAVCGFEANIDGSVLMRFIASLEPFIPVSLHTLE